MVDFTTDDLRKILEINHYEPNILEYYDNVTYNIRFYMLNHAFQKRFSSDRLDGKYFIVPDNEKIIIAETVVSEHYSVTSLQISSVHASAERNPSAATYKLEMRLHEVDGCDLVNKITAVSKAVGYESYIEQPYHIDIWFSGYEQSTGKPIQVIENMVLTYEVLLSEVKTQVDNNGCEYNFIMTPQCTIDKNVRTLFRIGEIQPGWEGNSSGTTFGAYVDRIVKLINEKYIEENPSVAELYVEDSDKYLTVRDYKIGSSNSYEALVSKSIKKYKTEKDLERQNEENIKKYKAMGQDYIPLASNVTMDNINTINFKNCIIDPFIAPQTQDSVSKGLIQFDAITSFEEALQELCFHSTELASYVVRPKYSIVFDKNMNGKECKKIFVDLIFTDNSYLNYFKERALGDTFSLEAEKERIKNMQLNEARNLILNNLLQKRYEWLYNGRDTSVLEFTSSIDKLWYANTGINNYATVNAASTDVVKQVSEAENQKRLITAYEQIIMDKSKKIEDALRESNKPLDGVRGLSSDKRLYLDDIYRCMSDDMKNEYLTKRIIYEKNDSLSNADNSSPSEGIQKVSIMTKAGYNNIHATGNLVEVELQILGDPFWLALIDDKKLYEYDDTNDFNKFHHFAFRVKYGLPENADGTYALEDVTEFSSIYQIVESTSIFDNGKFIQKIKGVLDPAFMHLARIEGL